MCRLPLVAAGSIRPILLKKSVSVFTTEKYTSEIEIPVLSRRVLDSDFT
jgi:hypothetical protein